MPLPYKLHLVVLSVAGFGLPQRGPRVHFVLDRAVQARHIFCYKVGPEKTRRFRDLFKEDCLTVTVTVPKGQTLAK